MQTTSLRNVNYNHDYSTMLNGPTHYQPSFPFESGHGQGHSDPSSTVALGGQPVEGYSAGSGYGYGYGGYGQQTQSQWPTAAELDVDVGLNVELNYLNYTYRDEGAGSLALAGSGSGSNAGSGCGSQQMASYPYIDHGHEYEHVEAQPAPPAPAPATTLDLHVPSSVLSALDNLNRNRNFGYDYTHAAASHFELDFERGFQVQLPTAGLGSKTAFDDDKDMSMNVDVPMDVPVLAVPAPARQGQAPVAAHLENDHEQAHERDADVVLSNITGGFVGLQISDGKTGNGNTRAIGHRGHAHRQGEGEKENLNVNMKANGNGKGKGNMKRTYKQTSKQTSRQKSSRKTCSSASRAVKAAVGVKAAKVSPVAVSTLDRQRKPDVHGGQGSAAAEFEVYLAEANHRGEGVPRCAFSSCTNTTHPVTCTKNLVEHLQSAHGIERSATSNQPVACRIEGCGQHAKPKDGNLLRHYRKHVLEVRCPHPGCGERMARSNQMKAHVWARHGVRVLAERFTYSFIPLRREEEGRE